MVLLSFTLKEEWFLKCFSYPGAKMGRRLAKDRLKNRVSSFAGSFDVSGPLACFSTQVIGLSQHRVTLAQGCRARVYSPCPGSPCSGTSRRRVGGFLGAHRWFGR